ncbi:MAG: S8 family serine peptidase [Clostridia bacterium]|nr:S8 family serine peptidase [Clostridia bacterium]
MKKSFKGFVALLLAVLLVVPAFAAVTAEIADELKIDAREAGEPVSAKSGLVPYGTLQSKATAEIDLSGIRNGKTFKAAEVEVTPETQPSDIVTIMVELSAAPAADVVSNLRNASSYRDELLAAQNATVKQLNAALNANIVPTHNYTVLFNGFAFEGEYRLVAEINAMEGFSAFVAPVFESPDLFNTTTQVGAVDAWDLGYTGAGYAVAIIDTGCKIDHPAFSVEPEGVVAFTRDDIASVIASGQLSAHGSQLNVNNVYYSGKIPFKWNYQGSNANVAHASSDHGTHVAGIAAGNGGEIRGIAPDAQICVMQVFNPTGGASWDNILPALEDCAVLGVAAANLSLGSPGGQETPWSASFNQTLQRCVDAGVNLAMAAGNDYDTSFNNAWGGNYGTPSSWSYSGYALVQDPDNGIVGSPSTWFAGMSVAAVQNSMAQGLYFEVNGENYGYSENDQNMVKFADALGGQEVEYVMVPGFGAPEDYEGIDVNGKVAVVSRGDITFIEKGYNAQDAGAAACMIYNNTSGTLNMVPFGTLDPSNNLIHDGNEGRIPHICVSQDTGAALAAAGNKVMYVANEAGIYPAIGGNQTTSFSSRGLTATMGMKPEITAPGGSIYSATDPAISGGLYAAWDGTSMATPHICGGMAIVSEYVDINFPNASAAERKNLVDAIIMSTATQVYSNSGDYAPVHEQGAGELDLAKAVQTKAYLTVEGTAGNRPKLELGDDPEKTGEFEMTFTVHNFGDYAISYAVRPHVLLNDLAAIGILDGQYVIVYSGDTYELATDDAVVYGDVNGDGDVTIADAILILRMAMGLIEPFGPCDLDDDGEVTVADAIIAARIAMDLMDPIVDGDPGEVEFDMPENVVVPAGGTADVTVRVALTDDIKGYIDYYYTSGALLEGFVQLVPENEEDVTLSVPFIRYYGDWNYPSTIDRGYYYEDVQWNSNNYPNTIGYKKGSNIYGLGINPYVETEDLSYYLADRNAISPNGDGLMDTVNLAYTGLLRNSNVRYLVLDPDTGSELDVLNNLGFMRKGYWADDHRTQLGVTEGLFPAGVNFSQYGGEVIIRIEAQLDNDGRHTTNEFTTDASECWYWDTPVVIDTEAPVIENFNAGDTFTFDVTDTNYVAYVGIYTVDGDALGTLISEQGLFETERGVTTAIELQGNDTAYIVVADYAMNERVYLWNGSELIEMEGVQPPAPVTIPDLDMYCYGKNLNSQTWVRFSTTNLESLYYGGGINSDNGDYTCATYTGEYVYAVTASKQLIRYDASDITGWTNKTTIGTLNVGYTVNEMAYNRATGKLYIVDGLAEVQEVNPDNAALTPVGDCQYGIAAMDFTPDGDCYIVDAYGEFCSFDIATCEPTALIGDGYGFVPYGSSGFFIQCGCYAEGVFFWFAADSTAQYYADMHLLAIDVNSGEFIDMGAVYGGLYCLGMFAYTFIPPASSIDPTCFYDNFENGFNWDTIDADGDGNEWAAEYFDQGLYQDGPKCAVSYSYTQAEGILYPDNWMISPEFEVGADCYLSFFTASANPATGDISEHYQVIIIPQGTTPENGVVLDDVIMDTNALTEHLYDLSAFAGETVSICLRHYDCFDQYTFIVDSVGVGPLK